jgi:endonuclease I
MAWAQGPNGSETYYQAANGKKGQALKTAMYGIIKTHTNIGYDGLYEAYRATDTRPDGYVRDWYSNATYYTHVKDKAGTYHQEGDCYNREHSVPQSWFQDYEHSSIIKADIVHVLPTDGYVNNQRGNYPLAKVGTWTYRSANEYSKLGSCATPGYSGRVFEPNDEIKGDMARIYFYMATCYEDVVDDWAGNATANIVFDGTTYPAFKTWYLNMLMEWSKNDPVDEVEIARNNAVKVKQGNRNPFVDYPGLEDYIWGDKKTVAFSYDNYEGSSSGKRYVTMSFSPTSVTATLGESFTAPTLSMSPSGLTVTYSSSNTNVATVNASTGAVTLKAVGTTTITASFAGNDDYYANSATYMLTVKKQGGDDPTPVTGSGIFEKVTSTAELESGKRYIIVSGTHSLMKFDGTAGSGNITISNSRIDMNNTDNSALILTMEKVGNYWTVKGDDVYMALTSDKNSLNTATTSSANTAKWTISVNSGTASVTNVNFSSRSLKYNTSSDMFRCYTSGQADVEIFKELEPTTTPGDIVKDGKIDWNDLKALVKILLGITPAGNNIDTDAANVNGDHETNIADVTKLVNMILQNNQ